MTFERRNFILQSVAITYLNHVEFSNARRTARCNLVSRAVEAEFSNYRAGAGRGDHFLWSDEVRMLILSKIQSAFKNSKLTNWQPIDNDGI